MAGRTTSPNGSRPGWPTVHKPKENRCSGPGVSASLAMVRTLSPQGEGRDLEGAEVEPDGAVNDIDRFQRALEQVDHGGVVDGKAEGQRDWTAAAPRLVQPYDEVVPVVGLLHHFDDDVLAVDRDRRPGLDARGAAGDRHRDIELVAGPNDTSLAEVP